MKETTYAIQTALMPLYYKDFHCIMGACQDNCCDDGWKISFNKKDYLKLKRSPMSQKLQARIPQHVVRLREQGTEDNYAEIRLDERGCCPFHDENGMCLLQLECSAEALPRVCQTFPRQKIYTAAGLECSLSPACEAVLFQLWDLPQGIDFWEEPLPSNEVMRCSTSNPAALRFQEIRSLCVDVLQERSLRLSQRLLLLGFLLQQLRKLDWEIEGGIDAWLTQGMGFLHNRELADELDKLPGNKQMFLMQNHGIATDILVTSGLARGNTMRNIVYYQLCESIKTTVQGKEQRTILDIQRYRELEEKLLMEFPELDEYFFENLMVSVAFKIQFPFVSSSEALWRSYVYLCSLYSFYRFAAVCGSAAELSRARLFHVLVSISRAVLHNSTRWDRIMSELFQNDSVSLAHMAILVNG